MTIVRQLETFSVCTVNGLTSLQKVKPGLQQKEFVLFEHTGQHKNCPEKINIVYRRCYSVKLNFSLYLIKICL